MKFFKVIGFFLRFGYNYRRAKRNYEKYGYVGKIIGLIFSLLLPGLAAASTYGAVYLIRDLSGVSEGAQAFFVGNFLKILGAALLIYFAVAFGLYSIVSFIQNAIICFAAAGSSKKFLKKQAGKEAIVEIDPSAVKPLSVEEQLSGVHYAQELEVHVNENEEKPKTARWFDIMLGVINLVFAAATVGAVVVMFII